MQRFANFRYLKVCCFWRPFLDRPRCRPIRRDHPAASQGSGRQPSATDIGDRQRVRLAQFDAAARWRDRGDDFQPAQSRVGRGRRRVLGQHRRRPDLAETRHAAAHEPDTNRMNIAVGLTTGGELLVISSGWSNRYPAGKREPLSSRHSGALGLPFVRWRPHLDGRPTGFSRPWSARRRPHSLWRHLAGRGRTTTGAIYEVLNCATTGCTCMAVRTAARHGASPLHWTLRKTQRNGAGPPGRRPMAGGRADERAAVVPFGGRRLAWTPCGPVTQASQHPGDFLNCGTADGC